VSEARLLGSTGRTKVRVWESRNPCWELHDEVVVSPIEEYLGRATETWDLILLLDVLEHFEHRQGAGILAAARSRLTRDGQFFVGTPAVWME